MATSNIGEAPTSPGGVANVFAPAIADDDEDAELMKLHADDDDDEVSVGIRWM